MKQTKYDHSVNINIQLYCHSLNNKIVVKLKMVYIRIIEITTGHVSKQIGKISVWFKNDIKNS